MQKLWWRRSCCAFSPCALLLSIPQTFQINPSKEGKRRRWTFISLCEMYGQNVDISSTETEKRELEVLKGPSFFCYLHLGKLEIFFGHKRFAISTVLKKHLLWISFEKQWNDGQREKFQFLWERKEHLPNSIDVGTYSPFLDFPS